MSTVRVQPDVPAVGRQFDYAVPDRWAGRMQVGCRVRIRLHNRPVGGWVTAVDPSPPAGVDLQPITGYSGLGPPPEVMDLAVWAAWRWAMPVATVLRVGSPDRNVWALPACPTPRLPPPAVGSTEIYRLGPATDPLPVVLEVVDAAGPGTVVVLVPNLGWADRLADRLRRRGLAVAGSWAEAAAGWPVVVGSRTTAWAPVPRLAAAVVLDAHDEAYRDRYDAVEVVAERAARQGVRCRLVSACPTAVQVARYPVVADDRSGWPAVSVVDRRAADPRTGLLSEELVRLADRVLPAGQPLVCVLNRTGRAKLLACAACGELARCHGCGRPVEQVDDRLACRSCGQARPVVCAACGATRLKVLRPGVSRVRDELEALLGTPVGEVAGPVAAVPDTAVLVGTEAVLHRVRRAAAVAFLDFDQHLLAARFTAAEDALALLARAGRLGPVLVQTRLPDHPVLAAAVAGDPLDELPLRRQLDLPPYAALATLSGDAAAAYGAALAAAGPVITAADLGDGRWLVRAPDHRTLCDALADAPRPPGTLRVAVDPTDV
ncbi:MAG TPA: hypothetical protein VHB02_10555 [Acidimicrobiales bacterium]|nr:hypothetical protein [Acidimicrobiales bacterium]